MARGPNLTEPVNKRTHPYRLPDIDGGAKMKPQRPTDTSRTTSRQTLTQPNHTPIRTVRVKDDLWNAVHNKAAKNGQTVTDVIISALTLYVVGAE